MFNGFFFRKYCTAIQDTDDNKIQSMRFACWVTKARINTLRMCSTYCFSTTPMVTWRRFDITLYYSACLVTFPAVIPGRFSKILVKLWHGCLLNFQFTVTHSILPSVATNSVVKYTTNTANTSKHLYSTFRNSFWNVILKLKQNHTYRTFTCIHTD